MRDSVTRLTMFLDDDATGEEVLTLTEADNGGLASVCIANGTEGPLDEWTMTGPAPALMEVLGRLLTQLRTETSKLGEVCRLCGKRGINQGSYAVPTSRDVWEHIGCAADEERARRADERHLSVVP